MESEKPRKEIIYYENSMQPIQTLSYKNNTLHNINEPALILYNKNGSIYSKSYFVEGLLITEEEFFKLHSLFKNNILSDIYKTIEETEDLNNLKIILDFAKFYNCKEIEDETIKKMVVKKLVWKSNFTF